MQHIERLDKMIKDDINVITFVPNEEVRNMYVEENERMRRNDQRFQEDIERDNANISAQASIQMIIDNSCSLADGDE
jgi:predicted CoA-binding protein